MNSSTNTNNNNSNPTTNGNNISLLTKQQQHYIFMQQQQQQSNRRRSSVFANGNSNLNARHQSIVIPPTRIAGPNLQHHIDSNNNNNNDFAFLNSNNSFVNLNGNDFSFPIHQHQNDYNMNMLYNNSNNYFAFNNNNNQHLPFTSNNINNSSNGSISNLNFAASAGRKFSLQYVPKTAPNMSFCSSNENVNNQNDNQQKNKQFHFQQQNSFMGPPLLKSQQQQQQQSFMMPQQELKHKNNALFNSYRRSSIQPFMQMNPNQSFRNVNFDQPLNSATSSTTTTSKPESLLSPIDVNMFVKKDEEENSIQWNLKYTGISPVKSHSEDDDDLPDPIQQSKIHSNRNINLKLKKFKRFDDFNFQEQQQQIQSQNQINRFSPLSNLDPLASKTTFVTTTFKNNNENFQYETQASNPRRLLTKPNIPNIDINPYNCDNEVGDHIIHVGDVIGVYDPHMENLTRYKSTPSMTSRNGFKIMDLLGKGTFGQVIKCENLADGSIVAIKMIKASEECMVPSFMECKVLQRLQKQQRLLGRNNNNNINERNDNQDDHFINFLEEFVYKGHLCIVFELLGPSVLEVLQSNKFHGLHWDLITSFSKQLFHSLENLKMANVIHCDLKPENILLKNNGNPANGNSLKIIDFGASCFENQTVYSYIQSRFYRAPEVVLGLPYTSGIDMWSVGCVIAELYLGIPLFPGQSEYDLMVRIIESKVNVDAIPPKWMLDRSKFSTLFFHYDPEEQKYTRLKSIDEYNIDLKEWKATNNEIIIHHLGYPRDVEKPGKKYFENSDNFCKLILLHRFHKLAHLTDIEKLDVLKKRWIFHKFLQKCLDIDPFKRYTPTEALRDPFITGKWINNYDFEADVDFKDFLTVEKQNIFGKTSLSPSKSNSEKKKDTSPKSQSHDHCTKLENLQL